MSRDIARDGGSRVIVTSAMKHAEQTGSGEQPESSLGKEQERESLLGRLV